MSYSIVIVLGAPRSGTTWLQRLLGAHEAVATTQETELLNGYVGSAADRWRDELVLDDELWANRRHKGLPAVLTTEEFHELLLHVVRYVYDKVAGLKPGASVVLDKNPGYATHAGLIASLLPEARFLHMLRDGRDAATSLMAAGRSWGSEWAPKRVEYAAERWRDRVRAVQNAGIQSDRYLEVRYEDLLADGPGVLHRSLEFCGVPETLDACRALYSRFEIGRLRDANDSEPVPESLLWSGEVRRRLGAAPAEPKGFYGEGGGGKWRSAWTARDRWAFARTAGDLLVALGYERDDSWTGVSTASRMAFEADRAARAGLRRAGRAAQAKASRHL